MHPLKKALFKIHFFHNISPTNYKYLYLLLVLVALVLVSPFSGYTAVARLFFSVVISFVIVSGLYTEYEHKRTDYIELLLGVVAILATWVDFFFHYQPMVNSATHVCYACFFLYFLAELISRIVISSVISLNLVFAAIVGFISIALLGAILAALLHNIVPDAYNFYPEHPPHVFEEYVYYSFVTATTVGYGDVLPTHAASKTLAIFISLSAHMYSTIVLGIIIGKYLSKSKSA